MPGTSLRNLSASIEYIKGVGPKTLPKFHQLGFFTLRDILYHLPREYHNYQTPTLISEIQPGKIIIKGKISDLKTIHTRRRNFTITEGVIRDSSGALRAVWFNQPYRSKSFDPDQEYYFSGDYDFKYHRYQLTSPSAVLASDLDHTSRLQPVYPARGEFKSSFFKKLLSGLRPQFFSIPDLIPADFLPEFLAIKSRSQALSQIHFPTTLKQTLAARQYLAYEELFLFILSAKLTRRQIHQLSAPVLPFSASDTKAVVSRLPFNLTPAQKLAAWNILQDLAQSRPMNRLLQGDVGSGKTVVAAIAAAQTATAGYQTALLVPTAILATQHYQSLSQLLAPLGVKVALLTSATKQKPKLKSEIQSGAIDLVIGTHALLTDDTIFHSLALCVIDEQHRLGVADRQKLFLKTSLSHPDLSPHLLSMTATPIPRSLQLTLFGDLDISLLRQLSTGRQPVTTKILTPLDLKDQLYPKIRELITSGQQVYWVCRSISDSDSATTSLEQLFKKLSNIFPKFKIDFIHGKLKPDLKDQKMAAFTAGKIDLLLATTVIEVGINVPNANLIIISDADRYGLAQLHQLRGRVGRGQLPGFCYLITSEEKAPSRRLKELEKSTDGFHLSEVDLKLRGPGEIYGSLQHGVLNLQVADFNDQKLITAASEQAELFAKDPALMVKYQELNQSISHYQKLTTLN